MNLRLASIIRKEFIQIIRDSRDDGPYYCDADPSTFPAGVRGNHRMSKTSRWLFGIKTGPRSRGPFWMPFAVRIISILLMIVGSQDEYRNLIENGQARAVLIIPPDYDRELSQGRAQVSMVLDGSDATVGSTALSAAHLIGQAYATKVMTDQTALSGHAASLDPPVQVSTQVWYNPDLISAYFMIPGVVGMILSMITAMLTATAVVRERERGTIEQLIVTPIRSWELIVGKLLPYVALAFVDVFEILIIGHFWFQVPIRGDMSLILLLSGLFIISSLGIGLFASTIANTQQEAMITVLVTMLPSIFLSGFFFPIDAMPQFLQVVSYLIPLRFYLVIIRALMIKGVGAEALQNEIIALVIFAIVIMAAASARFRKRLD